MNIATSPLPAMSERRFVLATDLDGTFLGGTEADRSRLYNWIEENRMSVGLIFVTGRDPEFIIELCKERGLPWPEYVVCDVGTSIAEVESKSHIAPIPPLEEDIASRWNDMGASVRDALADANGLTLQPTEFRYRVSYDLDAAAYDGSAQETVEKLGLDWLISDNRFFDVLPKGISKGPSIRKLVSHLGIEESRVLVAGDTMNDLSMIECGLPAVAVGNSEQPLLDRVSHLDHVHTASAHGAAGILEAIAAFDLHDTPKGA